MKSPADVDRVLALWRQGHNISQIARMSGVSRPTARRWINGGVPRFNRANLGKETGCPRCSSAAEFVPGITVFSYAYLLGLYLGDGFIARHRRGVFRLRIYLDLAHPLIIEEGAAAVSLVMPTSKVDVQKRTGQNMVEVGSYSRHWPHLFPQHGSGPKHERPIVLERWQELVVDRYPGRLLRGLIHSDGCRVTNKIRHPKKTYSYPRYFFSNRSHDIQRIFCDACDRLGIAWRQDGPWNISVARRDAVALMDRHVGPKR